MQCGRHLVKQQLIVPEVVVVGATGGGHEDVSPVEVEDGLETVLVAIQEDGTVLVQLASGQGEVGEQRACRLGGWR